MGAPLALIRAAALNARELGRTVTAGAVEVRPITHLKQVIETCILGREAVLKLAKGGGFRAHTYGMAETLTCRKGIIPSLCMSGRVGQLIINNREAFWNKG